MKKIALATVLALAATMASAVEVRLEGQDADGKNGTSNSTIYELGVKQAINNIVQSRLTPESQAAMQLGGTVEINGVKYQYKPATGQLEQIGVGGGAGMLAAAGNTTTVGRIGSGFIYADWKAQIAYTTPNFSGFQATIGLTQAWDATSSMYTSSPSAARGGAAPAFEGKASYSFAANDVTGKVWVSGLAQRFQEVDQTVNNEDRTAYAGDIGANVNLAGFGLTGYYYSGQGIGQTVQFMGSFDNTGKMRDSHGGYVQATYVLPTKTKVGLSWGQSTLESNGGADLLTRDVDDSMWAVGLYHPLTKHLNLVAEYNNIQSEAHNGNKTESSTYSGGAILFF